MDLVPVAPALLSNEIGAGADGAVFDDVVVVAESLRESDATLEFGPGATGILPKSMEDGIGYFPATPVASLKGKAIDADMTAEELWHPWIQSGERAVRAAMDEDSGDGGAVFVTLGAVCIGNRWPGFRINPKNTLRPIRGGSGCGRKTAIELLPLRDHGLTHRCGERRHSGIVARRTDPGSWRSVAGSWAAGTTSFNSLAAERPRPPREGRSLLWPPKNKIAIDYAGLRTAASAAWASDTTAEKNESGCP